MQTIKTKHIEVGLLLAERLAEKGNLVLIERRTDGVTLKVRKVGK